MNFFDLDLYTMLGYVIDYLDMYKELVFFAGGVFIAVTLIKIVLGITGSSEESEE